MSLVDLVYGIVMVGWLVGVGLLTHAVPLALNDNEDIPDYIQTAIFLYPERASMVLSIVIVGWPLTVPALLGMAYYRKEER